MFVAVSLIDFTAKLWFAYDDAMGAWKRHSAKILVGTMIVVLAAFNLFVLIAFDGAMPGNYLVATVRGLTIGVFVGQLNLICVWAAISQGNLVTRLPWAILLTIIMWSSLLAGQSFAMVMAASDVMKIGISLALGCIVAQIPLWIASRFLGWRLTVESDDTISHSNQFDLRHMLLGTVLLAVSMGLLRFVLMHLKQWDGTFVSNRGIDYVFYGAAIICNTLLVVPTVGGAFMKFRSWKALMVAWAIGGVIAVVVSLIEYGSICAIIGGPGNEEVEWGLVFIGTNVGQMLIVVLCLNLLERFSGFRLMRRTAAPKSTRLKSSDQSL